MAKLILKNGRNYGDASNYKDLLSRPTINTHLVEGEGATSGSLDIFKYISLEDYNDLLFKNPYALYAVCDEDNIIKNYFIHGSQTYSFTDYFQVSELPEEGDSSVLYYLKEDTDTYGKGMWFWAQNETGTYEYINISAPDVDSKTIFIVPETGALTTQIGGYIVDNDELVEKQLIANKMPRKCSISEDEKYTILEFNYDYYFCYTPTTTYKITFNYSGDVNTFELFPTDTQGTDNFIFEEDKFIMRLNASDYPSVEPTEYHLTLSWFEPQHISPINKLFLDIDGETIEWVDSKMHTDIVQNAYTSINGLDDYLYNVYYNNMDYPGAEKFFATHPNLSVLGGCATVHSGDLTGRVYDNFYDESVEFVVETSNRVGRYATIGVASSIEGLTKDVVGNGEYSEMYEILPFMIHEGINEYGVVVTSHLIKADKESGTFIRPDADTQMTLNSNAIPRYVLDNFRTAGEAVVNLRDHVLTKVNQGLLQKGYVPAYIICDGNSCYCIQLVEEAYAVTTDTYLTNFYLWGTTPNTEGEPFYTPETGDATVNGVTLHGQGLERYNKIAEIYSTLNNRAAIFDTLKEIDYEKVYSEDTRFSDWCWLEDVQVNTPVATILANSEVQRLKAAYPSRSRDAEDPNYGTWHSKHRGVYNSLLKSLIITIQGDDDHEYRFSLSEDSVELAKMVLGRISDTEVDTSQNSILQVLADCIWSEHRPAQINYNNETIVYGSPAIKEDYWHNQYFTLSNTLNGSSYILIRVYIDDNHNVLGARRYDQYFGKYEELDPGVGSFLPVHSLVGFSASTFLTISGMSAFKLGTLDGWHGDGNLQYSTDKEMWTAWDGLTPIVAVQQSTGKYEIYLRGEGGTTLGGTNFTMIPGNAAVNLTIKGVLSTLMDFNRSSDDIAFADSAFKNAFKGMDLYDISSLLFPRNATNYMYESMFENCASLTYIPKYVSNYIGNYSYKNAYKGSGIDHTPLFDNVQMIGVGAFEGCFSNCQNLVIVEKLPYETLTQGCYKSMFANCKALVKVDNYLLPSTSLANNCYESMFEGCISLGTPMYLNATILKQECYKSMFKDCVNIEFGDSGEFIRIPYNGTGISATDCCLDMFAGTDGDVPETTGTPLINKEYHCIIKDFYFESVNPFSVECTSMLSGRKVEYSYDNITWVNWTGFLLAPPKTNGKHTVYFRGNLVTNVTNNTFGNFKVSSPTSDVDVIGNPTVLIGGNGGFKTKTLANLFNGSTGLRSAKNLIMPRELPSDCTNAFESMFECCTHLIETPVMDFPNASQQNGWAYAFCRMYYGCTSLVEQPDIRVNSTALSMFESTFMGCTKLSIPKKIQIDQWIDSASTKLFMNTYRDCTSLTATPSLDYIFKEKTVPYGCFQSMFLDCTSLTTIVDFPTDPISALSYGFFNMFENTKVSTPVTLTAVPSYGATYTYTRMFAGCKNLIEPPTLPDVKDDNPHASYTYYRMFAESGLKTPPVIKGTASHFDCAEMFVGCTALEIPENYMFPKTFTNGGNQAQFFSMFANCTSLTRTPKFDNVPHVPNQGFRNTFLGCTSLKHIEDFSVITSMEASGGSNMTSMFEGCINLKIGPAKLLPTYAAAHGYEYMFKGTAIGTPPEILATGDAGFYAFQGMFQNCKNLKYPPDLHITNYDRSGVCESMCSGCIGINWVEVGTAYRLPATGYATTLGNTGCRNMFAGNTINAGSEMPTNGKPEIQKTYYVDKPPENLLWISSINEGEKLNQKYRFASGIYWCSNLDEGNWTNGGICYDPEATKIYFYGRCANNPIIDAVNDMTDKPEGDFTGVKPVGVSTIQHKVGGNFEALAITGKHDYEYLFDGFTSLVQIDPDIEWDVRGRYIYTFAYTGLTSLTSIPRVDPTIGTGTAQHKYRGTFQGCANLENVPENILGAIENPSSNAYGAYTCMFAYSGIKSIPVLPTGYLPDRCFAGMFMGTNLSETTEITLPGGGNGYYIYHRMFKDATFKENVVIHDMLTPVKNYGTCKEMFMNTNITKVPVIAMDEWVNLDALLRMFKDCVNLKAPGTLHVGPNQNVGSLWFLEEMYDGCNFTWGPENMGTPYNIFDNEVVYTQYRPVFSNNEYITTLGECSMRTDGVVQDPNKTYWLFRADGYVTFTAPEPFQVSLAPYSSYSYDTKEWEKCYDSYVTVDSVYIGGTHKLYAKLAGVTEDFERGTIVYGGNKQVSVSGGMDGFYCCQGAFKDNREDRSDNALYDASGLKLDSPLIGIMPMTQMFMGCENLVRPPEAIENTTTNASVMTYKDEHFKEMFCGCSSLVSTILRITPPTKATISMYQSMYQGTAILEPPTYGVNVGSDYAPWCCKSMFSDCQYLLHPSKLVCTGDSPKAYGHTFESMYENCISLSVDDITSLDSYTFPEIFAPDTIYRIDTGQYAYCRTFAGCNSLRKACPIKTNTLAYRACESMYEGCENLSDASNALIPRTSTATVYDLGGPNVTFVTHTFYKMFYNCPNLTVGADALICNGVTSAWEWTYGLCSKLQKTPIIKTTTGASDMYSKTFDGCTSLTDCTSMQFDIAGVISENNPSIFYETFKGCSALTQVPAINIDNGSGKEVAAYAFCGTFVYCSGLEEITFTNLEGDTQEGCFLSMFGGCTSLKEIKGAAEWKINPASESVCAYMFNACEKLCMDHGFKISQLTTGDVKWRGVGDNAFAYMFNGCKKFYIPVEFAFDHNPEGTSYTVAYGAFDYTFKNTDICLVPENSGGIAYMIPYDTDIVGLQYGNCTFEGCANLDTTSGIVTDNGSVILGTTFYYDKYKPDYDEHITFDGIYPYEVSVYPGMWYRNGDDDWTRVLEYTRLEAELSYELSAEEGRNVYAVRVTQPASTPQAHLNVINNYCPPWAEGQPVNAKVKVYGKFESVLKWEEMIEGDWPDYTQYYDNEVLSGDIEDLSKLIIPEEIVKIGEDGKTYVRHFIFQGCARTLRFAPDFLPATKLYPYCYNGMFGNCKELVRPSTFVSDQDGAQELLELEPYCFSGMYAQCTSLTGPPSLPRDKQELPQGCYHRMFLRSGIERTPSVRASEVVHSYACYEMFRECNNITQGGVPKAHHVYPYAYYGMYRNCAKLSLLPTLDTIDWISSFALSYMFYGVKGIKWNESWLEGAETIQICKPTTVWEGTVWMCMFEESGGEGSASPPPAGTIDVGYVYRYDRIT